MDFPELLVMSELVLYLTSCSTLSWPISCKRNNLSPSKKDLEFIAGWQLVVQQYNKQIIIVGSDLKVYRIGKVICVGIIVNLVK